VSALFNAFLCYSQLLPQKTAGLALCRSAHSVAPDSEEFFCQQSECLRKIFVERLADFIAVSSRLTMRLRSAVQEIGFATCGKGGERLSSKLGISVSDATLLWSLYLVPLPEVGQVEVLGIDDWSRSSRETLWQYPGGFTHP
jgi:hypothetical protein